MIETVIINFVLFPYKGQKTNIYGEYRSIIDSVNGLSRVDDEARQEGVKELTTKFDLTQTDLFYNSTFIDNNMSHSTSTLDKSSKIIVVWMFKGGKINRSCPTK